MVKMLNGNMVNIKYLLLIFLSLSYIAPSIVFAQDGGLEPVPSPPLTRDKVSAELICQCGCGMTLLNCNHIDCPSGIPMREIIDEKIIAGISKEEIIQDFIDEYGEAVLAAPPKSGFNLYAWITPILALILGLIIVLFLLVKWSQRRRIHPTKETSTQQLDPDYLSKVEKELKDLE
jgi:cytochrome c-type biogenesis protein CcmH/NrfF